MNVLLRLFRLDNQINIIYDLLAETISLLMFRKLVCIGESACRVSANVIKLKKLDRFAVARLSVVLQVFLPKDTSELLVLALNRAVKKRDRKRHFTHYK